MITHLIHIGYAKTASTALQRWFEAHPQIAYAEGAIAGFRSIYELEAASARPTAGLRVRVTSCEGLSSPRPDAGVAVVDYQAMEAIDVAGAPLRACEALKAFFPNAKVLIVTRGFRSVILSSYSQYVRTSGDIDLPHFARQAGLELSAWNYAQLISAYRERFGDKNVIVLPYELLQDQPDQFITRLEKTLGLDHQPMPGAQVNRSLSPEEMAWYPALTRFWRRLPGPLKRALRRPYLHALAGGRLKRLVTILQGLRPRAPVSAEMISDEMLAPFAARAECLRGEPLYAPFLSEYLCPVGRR